MHASDNGIKAAKNSESVLLEIGIWSKLHLIQPMENVSFLLHFVFWLLNQMGWYTVFKLFFFILVHKNLFCFNVGDDMLLSLPLSPALCLACET